MTGEATPWIGEVTARTLAPFMLTETMNELHAKLVVMLDGAREAVEPTSMTADLMMATCCDEVIKGWQSKQETQRQKSYNQESAIECDVRVSQITPMRSQIVVACQGPTELLDGMRSKVIASVRRAVKKELK